MAMATCVISRHFGFPRQELKKKKAYTKYFKSALCLDAHGAFFFFFQRANILFVCRVSVRLMATFSTEENPYKHH